MPEVSTAKPRRAKRPAQNRSKPADGHAGAEVLNMTSLNRAELIAVAAYYRAEGRQFEPGHELEDWLSAESEVDRKLMAQTEGQAVT